MRLSLTTLLLGVIFLGIVSASPLTPSVSNDVTPRTNRPPGRGPCPTNGAKKCSDDNKEILKCNSHYWWPVRTCAGFGQELCGSDEHGPYCYRKREEAAVDSNTADIANRDNTADIADVTNTADVANTTDIPSVPPVANTTLPAECWPDGCVAGGCYTSQHRNGPYERLNLYYGLDSRDCRQFWNPIQVFWLDAGAWCTFFDNPLCRDPISWWRGPEAERFYPGDVKPRWYFCHT